MSQIMKPILYSTAMVVAILENRKNMTRRVVKPRYSDSVFEIHNGELCETEPPTAPVDVGDGFTRYKVRQYIPCKPRYQVGEILYVRETWRPIYEFIDMGEYGIVGYEYKASDNGEFPYQYWKPSIHMPKVAARIFQRVTDVRVERIQDISGEDCRAEGIAIDAFGSASHNPVLYREWFAKLWDSINGKPKPVYRKSSLGIKQISHYVSYPWEDIQEVRKYRGKDLYVYGNPWVFVYTFERCEKSEVSAGSFAGGCTDNPICTQA